MNRRDIHNSIAVLIACNTTAIANGEDVVGAIIDRQDSGALEFIVQSGAYTDGSATPLIEHGDDAALADAAAVDDAELLGTEAAAALSAANQISKVGYVGNKRYVRLTFKPAAASTLTVSAVAVKGALSLEGSA
jgi:hypothetical protein